MDSICTEKLIYCIVHVTERKLAEEDRVRLSRLVEESSDFIAIATPEGGTFYVNEAGRRLVGLDGIDAVEQTYSYFYRRQPLSENMFCLP